MQKYLLPILLILVVAAGGTSVYFYNQYAIAQKKMGDLSKNPKMIQEEEVSKTVMAVGKLIELPKETPTIATVTDKKKLQNQDFFKKVENGDKLLLYVKTRKVILYRPSENKIIEVGTLNVTQQPTGESQTPTPTPTKKLEK